MWTEFKRGCLISTSDFNVLSYAKSGKISQKSKKNTKWVFEVLSPEKANHLSSWRRRLALSSERVETWSCPSVRWICRRPDETQHLPGPAVETKANTICSWWGGQRTEDRVWWWHQTSCSEMKILSWHNNSKAWWKANFSYLLRNISIVRVWTREIPVAKTAFSFASVDCSVSEKSDWKGCCNEQRRLNSTRRAMLIKITALLSLCRDYRQGLLYV